MSNIHLTLTGKGGVGKSFVAFLLAQYFRKNGRVCKLIDTDPSNHTFALVNSLNVEKFDITDGDDVDQRRFDKLIEELVFSSENEPDEIVIDCGSSGFIGMVSYLISNQAITLLKEQGHRVIVHSLLVGGRDLRETLGNLSELADKLPGAEFVVWLNHQLFGQVAYADKSVAESKTFKKLNGRLLASIDLVQRKEKLHAQDIKDLMEAGLTFEEGIKSSQFSIMSRQRLKIVWDEVYRTIHNTNLNKSGECSG